VSELPDRTSPTRIRLGAELQACRTLAGINQRTMAREVGVTQPTVSRVERGELLLTAAQLNSWLKVSKAGPDQRRSIRDLAKIAHTETRTWRELRATQSHLQDASKARNSASRIVQIFAPTVLPGLLQTADYARRIIQLADVTGSFDHTAALAARIERQGVLRESGRRFEFIVTERLLTWEPEPGVLRPQLAQLIAVAELETVDLAVLPADFAAALPWHNFVLRHPTDGSAPYVSTELLHGAQTITDPDSVAIYVRMWAMLWEASATGPAAIDMIRDAS
jgi:transcriptional regulator with XRE-family HTH domain